jgi:OFA family oxalate/formate antiporter-like MFS transporter
MRRWIILAASVVMQMCLGATYSWSVYVQPLKKITGLLQGPVQLPFTVFYFAFPATMIFAGMWLPRLGPRRCAVTGGILFGSGWLVAGFGGLHFGLTIVGIGLLAGIGVGLAQQS